MRHAALALLALGFLVNLSAQVRLESQTGQPISITVGAPGPQTEHANAAYTSVPVDLRAVDKKPINAYSLVLYIRDQQDKLKMVQVHSRIVGLVPADRQRYAPGDRWKDQIPVPPGIDLATHRCTLTLDFVSFEDGSGWGPDKQKESKRIDGRRAGFRQAMAYLQHVRSQQGDAAALAEIASGRK